MTRDPLPRWLLAVICAAAFVIVAPFAPWVIIGTWLGLYGRKLHRPLTRKLGGRSGLAAWLTVGSLLVILLPIAALVASIALDAVALVQRLLASDRGREVLERLARGDGNGVAHQPMMSVSGIVDLLMSQGDRAWAITQQVAGAAASVVIGLLILVSGMYGVLVEGGGWWAFAEHHAPMQPETMRRFAAAFVETGRGLASGSSAPG